MPAVQFQGRHGGGGGTAAGTKRERQHHQSSPYSMTVGSSINALVGTGQRRLELKGVQGVGR